MHPTVHEGDVVATDVRRVLTPRQLRAAHREVGVADRVVAVVLARHRPVHDLAVLDHQTGAVVINNPHRIGTNTRPADRHVRRVHNHLPRDLTRIDNRTRRRNRHPTRSRQHRPRRHTRTRSTRKTTARRGVAGRGVRRRRLPRFRASTLGAALALARVRSLAQLAAVAEAVAVGVPPARVRVEAPDLGPIAQAIAIGVGAPRVRAQPMLAAVVQAVAVGIALGGGASRREVVAPFPAIGQSIVIAIASGARAHRRGEVRENNHRQHQPSQHRLVLLGFGPRRCGSCRITAAVPPVHLHRNRPVSAPGRSRPHPSPVGRVTFRRTTLRTVTPMRRRAL